MKLRKYEREWIARIRKATGRRLIVGPTGSGKTVVAAHLIRDLAKQGKRVLFLAHRRELIIQARRRLHERGVRGVGVIKAGVPRTPNARVQVASVQTLVNCLDDYRFDAIFIDEAHHATAASYRRVIDANPAAELYGLTATPRRLDGKPLSDLFDTIVQCAPVSRLIADGHIAKPRIWSRKAPDLSGVDIRRGDYDRRKLSDKVNRRELVGDIVAHWWRLAGERQTVVYAVDVAHARALAKRFQQGCAYQVALLTGETDERKREKILADFERGKVRVLVNVEVLTEGWDSGAATCCVMARPTLSETLLYQMSGRVMRPNCARPIILDHAGNFNRHGLYPHEDRVWTLEDEPGVKRKGGAAPTKDCPACGSACPFGARECAFCGHVFWTNEPPQEVKDYLVELSKSPAQRAVELYAIHKSTRKVAELLGVHRAAVGKWLKAAGVDVRNHNHKPDEMRRKAVKLYAIHKSTVKVAKLLRVSDVTVSEWLKAAGVELRGRSKRKPDEMRQETVRLYAIHKSARKVAELLRVGPTAVRKWLKAAGVELPRGGRPSK